MHWLRLRLKPVYLRLREWLERRLVDRRQGIRTSPVVHRANLGFTSPDHANYEPSSWRILERVMPERDVRSDDVFVDIGSGMGRVVYQAALTYPLRRVIGVELSEQLNDIARRNITENRGRLRCKDVELYTADAGQWELPDDVTIIYLYNPVRGDLFRDLMQRIVDSLDRAPRAMRIIYRNPVEHEEVLSTGRFRIVRRHHGWRPGAAWRRSSGTYVYEALVRSQAS